MEPLRDLIERAWESLTEGWRELLTRSSGALTHFGTEGARKKESQQEFPHWSLLAAETWETAQSVVIRMEIPGMNEDDLAIDIHGIVLRIRGQKRSGATQQKPSIPPHGAGVRAFRTQHPSASRRRWGKGRSLLS
jgi:HSP20 family molecular chaperone IbpA